LNPLDISLFATAAAHQTQLICLFKMKEKEEIELDILFKLNMAFNLVICNFYRLFFKFKKFQMQEFSKKNQNCFLKSASINFATSAPQSTQSHAPDNQNKKVCSNYNSKQTFLPLSVSTKIN
jgi:hypothetical protein